MKRTEAVAEDLRRIGVAFIVVDALGAFFQGAIGVASAFTVAIIGVLLLVIGYWFHGPEEL